MNVGDLIPEILGIDQEGKKVTRAEYKGKKIALYFYPKDSTSGCTAEACSLRDNYDKLKANGYEIIGCSINDAKSHQKFIQKEALPFRLIADTEKTLVQQFGVWGEKSLYGRKYLGTFRTTFLIDENGIITKIFLPKEIKTKIHGEQILNV